MLTSKTDKQKEKEGRRHHNKNYKPLHNKRFYLDLKSHIASNNLEQKLKSLGASVECFLVKEVNYVVTDRPHWKAASSGSVSGSTPKCGALTPLGLCSESPATLDSPGDVPRGGARRNKTRAEAMLERARLQPQQCTVDPLENASRWNIPIWPLEKVLKWLEKVREKYLKPSSSSSSTSTSSGTALKNPYIKLENINRKYRPVYKELSVWPTINLDFEPGGCPFSIPKVSDKTHVTQDAAKATPSTKATVETPRMTRKAHNRVHRGNGTTVALQNSGYCEICQVTYADQRHHVQSERHVQFVANSNNYLSLDQLIKQGPNMDTFLKLNGTNQMSECQSDSSTSSIRSLRRAVKLQPLALDTSSKSLDDKMLLQQKESLEVQCNGMWSHSYDTRHGGMKSPVSGSIGRRVQWEMPCRPQRLRRASASYCSSTTLSLQQQLSPTGSDSGHHLRSRGQIWLPSNLLGTTAEDEAYPSRTRLADPQSARTSRDIPVNGEEMKSPPPRQEIKRKRLSVEEKLIEDNKAYYKLELKNSKLRSSGYWETPIKQEVKEEKVEPSVKCNGEQTPVTVRFQRVRKSELTLLSDEAESFMFGEPARRDSSTESSEDEDDKKSKPCKKEEKKSTESKNQLHCDESSVGSIDTCSLASSCDTNSAVQKKRKRRTHAEAFIHDNLDYYKFEIPGSRLRFQGSILPPAPAVSPPSSRNKATCNGAHSKIVTCSNEASNEKEKLVESPESSKEKPVSEPESRNSKKQEKDDDKRKEEKDESNVRENVENEAASAMERLHFSFEAVPQSEPWFQTYTRQDEGEEFYAYSYMTDSCYWKPFLLPYEIPLPDSACGGVSAGGMGSPGFVRKKRNRFAHLLDKKPRKSPRCHASTLAILSSLMHHRRRRDPDKSKDDVPKSETSVGNSTEDEGASRDVPNTFPASSSETSQASEPEPVPAPAPAPAPAPTPTPAPPPAAVPSSDFKSESDADLHELARNIDKMFGLGSDAEVSGSDNDVSGDEKITEAKGRKSGKKNAQQSKKGSKAKKEASKHQEMLEIDPAAVDELTNEPPPIVANDQCEIRCRGGPKMDVVTLIDAFPTCRCVEEPVVLGKDGLTCINPALQLGEASCNSSECGASSTCETVNFFDGPDGRLRQIRGRKRKRKKNMTGWPAEKQRVKKKHVVGKVNRTNENIPTSDDISGKCCDAVQESKKKSETAVEKKSESAADTVESSELSVIQEKHSSALSRTESVDSSEYQPCVRVTKMPDLSTSYFVAGISNNRRLRSSSLSSSPPTHSVPVPRKYPSLSADGLKRRASPRKCLPRASLQWNAWSTRKRR